MFHCPCVVESREPRASSPAQTELISRSAPAKAPGLLRKERLSHTGFSAQRRADSLALCFARPLGEGTPKTGNERYTFLLPSLLLAIQHLRFLSQ